MKSCLCGQHHAAPRAEDIAGAAWCTEAVQLDLLLTMRSVAGATVGIAGLGLGTAACLVLGGIGPAASVVAFAARARKQIVRWGS
jgi:hypothetical protein